MDSSNNSALSDIRRKVISYVKYSTYVSSSNLLSTSVIMWVLLACTTTMTLVAVSVLVSVLVTLLTM